MQGNNTNSFHYAHILNQNGTCPSCPIRIEIFVFNTTVCAAVKPTTQLVNNTISSVKSFKPFNLFLSFLPLMALWLYVTFLHLYKSDVTLHTHSHSVTWFSMLANRLTYILMPMFSGLPSNARKRSFSTLLKIFAPFWNVLRRTTYVQKITIKVSNPNH